MERRNAIVTALGPSGSGKSRFLADQAARFPRVISLDTTGETEEVYPTALGPTFGLDATLRALQVCAGYPRWHLRAAVEGDELVALCRRLVPNYDGRSVSLARALGGVALEMGEVYEIAPNAGAPREVLNMWRRGRHEGLSLLAATQRPASCAREVSANSHWLVAFRMPEPRDYEYVGGFMGARARDLVAELPPYHSLLYDKRAGLVWQLDAARRPYGCFTPRGADVPIG